MSKRLDTLTLVRHMLDITEEDLKSIGDGPVDKFHCVHSHVDVALQRLAELQEDLSRKPMTTEEKLDEIVRIAREDGVVDEDEIEAILAK